MILLYTLLVALLVMAKVLVDRRVRRIEAKYTKIATEAAKLANEPLYRPGNSNRSDPLQIAKRQYQLGVLAAAEERLEARHDVWQGTADRLGRYLTKVRDWKGRKLPYTFGVVDVALLLYLIDQLGVREYLSFDALSQYASTLFMR
jgi:hypothetical protein